MITYSPFNFASDPGSTPITFGASTFSRFTAIFARSVPIKGNFGSGLFSFARSRISWYVCPDPAKNFSPPVRVMAIAWSKDKVGKASGDVTVRDPVVLTTTLPRFLLTGDRGTMRLELDNVEGPAGDYAIDIATDGPLQVGQAKQTLRLAGKQRTGISLPINATAVGLGNVAVRVTGPNGFEANRTYALAAKPATQILTRRTVRPIAKNESITLSNDLFADLVPGTGGVQVSVGPSTALDVAALLKALDRYPYGCSEQTTSRALPLLYVNELAAESHLSLDVAIDQRIRDAIDRLLARQGPDGSFGLWSAGGDDIWLDAYVTDFLTRARERSFAVPTCFWMKAASPPGLAKRLSRKVKTAPFGPASTFSIPASRHSRLIAMISSRLPTS